MIKASNSIHSSLQDRLAEVVRRHNSQSTGIPNGVSSNQTEVEKSTAVQVQRMLDDPSSKARSSANSFYSLNRFNKSQQSFSSTILSNALNKNSSSHSVASSDLSKFFNSSENAKPLDNRPISLAYQSFLDSFNSSSESLNAQSLDNRSISLVYQSYMDGFNSSSESLNAKSASNSSRSLDNQSHLSELLFASDDHSNEMQNMQSGSSSDDALVNGTLKISSSHCKKLPIGSTGLATYNLATLLSKFSPINKFKLNTNARQIAHENSVASSDVDIEIISVSSEDISLPKTSLTESHNRKPSLSALIEEKKISLQQAKDKLKKHEDEMARVSRLTKKSLRNLGGFYQGMSESKRSSFKNEVDQAKLRLFIAQHQAVAMTDKRNPKFENWHNPFSILCYAWKMESKARKAKLLASKEIGPLKYEFKRMNSWIFRNDPLSALKNENVVSPAAAQENQAAYEPQQDLTDIKVRNARSSQHMTMQRKMNTALNTENVKTNQPSIIRSDLTDSLNRIKTKGKFLVGSVRRGFSMPRLPSQNKEVIEVPLRASTLPKSAPKLNVHINEINFWQNQDIIRLLNPE